MGEDLKLALEENEDLLRLHKYTYAVVLLKMLLKNKIISDIEFSKAVEGIKRKYYIKD